jgi:hypothetical protein
MLLDSEENINKIKWFISKKDNNIYGLYRGFILYSFDPYYSNLYYIDYTDRSFKSFNYINDNLLIKIKQKKSIEYDSIESFIKITNRIKVIDSLL